MVETENTIRLGKLFFAHNEGADIQRAKAIADTIAALDGPNNNDTLCNFAEALQYERWGGIDAMIEGWTYGNTPALKRMVSIRDFRDSLRYYMIQSNTKGTGACS